jgi:NADH-quinone oxidoreductase subunit J
MEVYLNSSVAFYALWAIILLSAFMVVHAREVFHSALFLALMFIGVAGVFILLEAEFLAVIQVLIYAGAVTVIILFAVMLTRRDGGLDRLGVDINKMKMISALIFVLALVGIVITGELFSEKGYVSGTAGAIAEEMFSKYIIHFELIAILLLAAMIAAIYLARRGDSEGSE